MVHDTVPFTLHFTLPPTPTIPMLHAVIVPGRKSPLEFVKHLEEQLSIAIRLESESNAFAHSIDGVAVMHVTGTSRRLAADSLFCLRIDALLFAGL
jgi:hypothetical protein